MVALTIDGLYEKVTEQQRDEDGNVFPLFFEDKWVFGQFGKKVCSVFLATDGMLETLFPFLIKNESVNIHVNLAKFFMDNRSLRIDEEGESTVKERIEDFVKNIPDELVNDDKTVVVLVNTSIESKLQPDDYYKEPDWVELKHKRDEEWKRLAYPHLFKEKETKSDSKTEAAVSEGQNCGSVEKTLHENTAHVVSTEVSAEEAENKGKPEDKNLKSIINRLFEVKKKKE